MKPVGILNGKLIFEDEMTGPAIITRQHHLDDLKSEIETLKELVDALLDQLKLHTGNFSPKTLYVKSKKE